MSTKHARDARRGQASKARRPFGNSSAENGTHPVVVHYAGPWTVSEKARLHRLLWRIEHRWADRIGGTGVGCPWVVVRHVINGQSLFLASRNGVDYVFREESIDALGIHIKRYLARPRHTP